MSRRKFVVRSISVAAGALLVSVNVFASMSAAQAAEEWNPESSYTTTDTGDGTYKVPMLKSDVPDVSVERVPASQNDEGRDTYYMVSTTMHLSPGAPIMKSYDLVNWETVSYAFDRLDISDAASLRNGSNSYGQGQWASSIRFHDGTFYVLINSLNLGGAFLYRTDDIENGAWTKTAFGRGFHDPSLFFDDANGGTPYIFYGGGGSSAVRLNPTLTAVEQDFPDVIRRSDYADKPYIGNDGGIFEGAQVSFIDGYYYVVMITWRSDGRQVVMFRSRELLGRLAATPAPYESHGVLNSNGFAQGSLVPVSNDAGGDDWHGFFFRDSYPVGRIPALIPATWSDGWPTFGNNGVVPVDGTFEKPIRLTPEQERFERLKSVVASDDFDNDAPHHGYKDEQWTLPTPPDIDETLVGVELFGNPGVESGSTEGWIANDGATLSTTTDAHAGSTAIAVTGRNATGSGPAQNVTGKVQHGVTYDVSAWIKYDNPASPARQAVPHHCSVRRQQHEVRQPHAPDGRDPRELGQGVGVVHDSCDRRRSPTSASSSRLPGCPIRRQTPTRTSWTTRSTTCHSSDGHPSPVSCRIPMKSPRTGRTSTWPGSGTTRPTTGTGRSPTARGGCG